MLRFVKFLCSNKTVISNITQFQHQQTSEILKLDHKTREKHTQIVESLNEEPTAGWPSLGWILSGQFKSSLEAIGTMFHNLIPQNLIPGKSKQRLTPLNANFTVPEEQIEPPIVWKQLSTSSMFETRHTSNVSNNDASWRQQKSNRPSKHKDPSLSGKHRSSSKRQDYAEFYVTGGSPQFSSIGQKDRIRRQHREKTGVTFNAEPKPAEVRPVEYSDAKFNQYTFRNKYADGDVHRY